MPLTNSFHRFAVPLLFAAALNAAEGVAPAANQFAWTAYRGLAQSTGNLILSPFSISTALSMVLDGARGRTAEEISSVLHQMPVESLAALMAELEKSANTGGNQLKTANGLWVQQGFGILPDFQKTLVQRYGAPLREVDFSGSPEQARSQVNSWTEQQTNGKIRDLFGPGSLGPQTRLVLTSAIYFYGKWQSAFDAKNTRPAPFRGPGGAVQTDFMNRTGSYGYSDMPDKQVLEMQYAGTPIAFDVLLPKSDDGLAALESSISAEELARWLGTLKTRTVEVALPKFRAESEFSLRQTLSHMGMPGAFSAAADFSGIDGRRDLMISDVRHKAFVDVSEEGTEAAAATGIAVRMISMHVSPNPVFKADHPFVFVIRDTRSGLVLFSGRLLKPKG